MTIKASGEGWAGRGLRKGKARGWKAGEQRGGEGSRQRGVVERGKVKG